MSMNLRPSALQDALAADAILCGQASTPIDYFQVVNPSPVDQLLKWDSFIKINNGGPSANEYAGHFFSQDSGVHVFTSQAAAIKHATTLLPSVSNPHIVSVEQGQTNLYEFVADRRSSSLDIDQRASLALKPATARTPTQEAARPTASVFLALLAARHNSINTESFHGLVRQVLAILSNDDELTSHRIKPRVESFEGLLNFLSVRKPTHPNLSLSRDGRFVASWSPTPKSKLTFTFKTENDGDWVGVNLVDPKSKGNGSFETASLKLPEPFADWI
jgi:hypothetical protein